MQSTINVPPKKRGRPATGKNPRIGIRIEQDLIDAIAAFQTDGEPPIDNQSEAIRRILRDWLIGHGYLAESTDE